MTTSTTQTTMTTDNETNDVTAKDTNGTIKNKEEKSTYYWNVNLGEQPLLNNIVFNKFIYDLYL